MLAVLALGACSGQATTGTSAGGLRPTTTVASPPAAVTTVAAPTGTSAATTTSTTDVGTTTSTTDAATTTTSTTIDPATLLPTLGEGDTGPDVVALQRMLNNATGTALAPNGVFGPETTEAIRNFQLYVGLEVTGVADHATRTFLIELDAGRSTAIPTWPVTAIGNGGADGCQVAVVGDSLMAGAARLHEQALAGVGCASAVDGVGGRSLSFGWQCRIAQYDGSTPLLLVPEPEPGNATCAPSGLELLRMWAEAGALGDLVVVALGTNDAGIHRDEATWIARWERALSLTGDRPVVFLTTAARPGSSRVPTQDSYSASLRRWCDTTTRCHLADWALAPAATDPSSYVDSVHLRRVATEQRAAFIAAAVRALLTATPAPGPAPLPTLPTTTTTSTSTSTTTTSTSTSTSTSTTVPATTTTTTTSSTTTTSTSTTTSTTTTTSSTTTTTTSPFPGTGSSTAATAGAASTSSPVPGQLRR